MSRITNEDQAVDFVRAARAGKSPFEIVAGGTRRAVGRPLDDLPMLDVSGLSGIVKYEPAELIVTAQPGTSLAEIKAVLGEKISGWVLIPPIGRGCWAPTAWRLWPARPLAMPRGPESCGMAGRAIRCWVFAP